MLLFVHTERWQATLQAVDEAKDGIAKFEMQQQRARVAQRSSASAARLLSRFFRRASRRSERIGKARLFMESAVRKAERSLMEKKRAQLASTSSKEQMAEALAEELFHTPGTLLTSKEFAHIYQESGCEELRENVDCTQIPFVNTIRTPDGTCNNLANPTQGSSFSAFNRIIEPRYEDGVNQLRGFIQSKTDGIFHKGPFGPPNPSARLISTTIIRDREDNETIFSHLVMQWGQFVDHDLTFNVEFEGVECDLVNCVCTDLCAPVRTPSDDQTFGVGTARNGSCLPFVRTVPACSEAPFEPRQQVNELTSYLDGSMVYGSTAARAKFLREFNGGRLREGPVFPSGGRPSLPTVPPCPPEENGLGEIETPLDCNPPGFSQSFVAGDPRVNEQVSLTVMHTLWLREHNRIAKMLQDLNSHWDDERVYQETRQIVGALIQKITLYDYLPLILGKQVFDQLIGPYPGYQPATDATIPNAFATAAYRFGHSQIQPMFERLNPTFESIPAGPLSLRDAFMNPQAYFDSQGTAPLVRGWITQPARRLDEFLNSILTNQLFERDDAPGMDLATLNIQRGRDHGLPPYLIWKNFCRNQFNISSDIGNELTKIRFLQTYGTLDTVDLFVGALAEEALSGSIVGATLACIFGITFSRVRAGDRFWYENPGVFTPAQLTEIKKGSIARILCDNGDAVPQVQVNAFLLGSRTPCFLPTIPSLDFQPWREDPFCYQRITILPHSRPRLDIDFLSGFSSSQLQNYPLMLTQSSTTITLCIPFLCPTSLRNTQVFIFPRSINGDETNFVECRLTTNSGLPPSTAGPGAESAYEGFYSTSNIQNSNGLFNSLKACEGASFVAHTYDCSAISGRRRRSTLTTTAELEHELARVLQSGGSNEGSSSGLLSLNVTKTKLEPFDINERKGEIPDLLLKTITGTVQSQSNEVSYNVMLERYHYINYTVNDVLALSLQQLKYVFYV